MRRVTVAFVALMGLLLWTPAAGAAVCKYLPPPVKISKKERFLRQTISQRRSWTLPHGRRYVKRVNADPANHERGYSILDFPMTAREVAYFERRSRLWDSRPGRRLDAYLRRHRDDFGGSSMEDDYPRPYLQLRVQRDLERHRAAIRRFYPFRFKLKAVLFSERQLSRVARSIDVDALEAEAIHVISYGEGSERVELDVATERADVHEVVRRMYGLAVEVTVLGPTPTFLECGGPASYEVEPDGRTLRVHFFDSGSITPRHVEVAETPYGVDVGVVVETPYIVTADRRHYTLTVTLAEPLGDRVVKSIEYGYRVRRGLPT